MSSKVTVVHARQLGDEVIEVGGQYRRCDLAVSDVEQFADVQRRLRATGSESIRSEIERALMSAGCEQVNFRHGLGALLDLLNGERRVGERTDPRACEAQVPTTALRAFARNQFDIRVVGKQTRSVR